MFPKQRNKKSCSKSNLPEIEILPFTVDKEIFYPMIFMYQIILKVVDFSARLKPQLTYRYTIGERSVLVRLRRARSRIRSSVRQLCRSPVNKNVSKYSLCRVFSPALDAGITAVSAVSTFSSVWILCISEKC